MTPAPRTPAPRGVLARYREWLAVPAGLPEVSLGEGDTPLLRVPSIERALGLRAPLFVKVEGQNPTGSFKDRGMTVAVSLAAHRGRKAVVCASTGNTAASAAAYAARAGLEALVVLPEGAVAGGKLAQAIACGARVAQVDGNFDQALALVREMASRLEVELVNSVNPARLEGQKTAAFEVCDALGEAPAYLAIPVGNAGNITAYWMGFTQYHEAGRISSRPIMLGFQAEGAAPLVLGRPVSRPETVATAIRIGRPASWQGAIRARDESGGVIAAVSDRAILEAQQELAQREGIFCEPASAASVAGVAQLARAGYFRDASRPIVCVLTGSGLKDPDRAARMGRPGQVVRVTGRLEEVAALLGATVPLHAAPEEPVA
ncbi:MAG: threonine synthase [Limnochordaceae bacterium]|nr:threonine synthase [Limnochordaceae bacterium]